MESTFQNLRSNTVGDRPTIHPSAFIDPSAQIIGNVRIGPDVFVGPNAVIRADEPGPNGKVQPVVIEAETNVQDGVIIHSMGGTSVQIGPKVTLAHGAIIHGPCVIGKECFIAIRTVLYSVTLEDAVWVGIGSIIMRATIPSRTMIPAGSVIRSKDDVLNYRITNIKEQKYKKSVLGACAKVRQGYLNLPVNSTP